MLSKTKDGYYIVSGNATRDGEAKRVGEKKTTLGVVGIAVGDDIDGNPQYANLKGWRDIGKIIGDIRKGESVFAIAKAETREYNGKMYTDHNVEFISVARYGGTQNTAPQFIPDDMIPMSGFDDDECPF